MGNSAPKHKKGGVPGLAGDFHSPLEQEPEPPKPVADMNAEEKAAWDKRMEAWHKKQQMAKLVEKNLAVKASHGAKPIEPPQPSSLLGKAKKAAHNHADQAMAGKPNAPPANESLKQRIERQALASAQGAGTGGSTAALGADIAKSKMNQDLTKKREAFERKETERKRKEEEDRKKAEAEKSKAKPKGLKDFLSQVEGEPSAPTTSAQPPSSPVRAQQPGLKAFLSQSEESPGATSMQQQQQQQQPTTATESSSANLPKKSNLQAFLSSSSPPAASEAPITSPVVTAVTTEPKPQARGLQAFLTTVEKPAEQPPPSPVSSSAATNNLSAFISSSGPATSAYQLPPSPVSSPKAAAESTPTVVAPSQSDAAVETERTEPAEDSKPAEGFVRRASRRVSTTVKKLLGRSGDEDAEAADAAAEETNIEVAPEQAPVESSEEAPSAASEVPEVSVIAAEVTVVAVFEEQASTSDNAPKPAAAAEPEGSKTLEDSTPAAASASPSDPAPDSAAQTSATTAADAEEPTVVEGAVEG